MADTKIQFPAPSGLTVKAYLRKYGTTSFINNSGHNATEVVVDGISTGDYTITVSEAALGWHRIYLVNTTVPTKSFASYDVYLQDDTITYLANDKDQNLIFQ